MLTDTELRDLILGAQEADDGFSVDVETGEWPETGYMVGGEGPEHAIPAGTDLDTAVAEVRAYIDTELDTLLRADVFLGGWRRPADMALVIDASFNAASIETAAALAEARDEDAIFDVDALEPIEA